MMKSIAFNEVRESEDYVLVDRTPSLHSSAVQEKDDDDDVTGDDDASYDYCEDAFTVPSAVPTLELDNDNDSVVVASSSLSGATSTVSNRALLDDEFLQSVRELEIEFPVHLRVFSSSTLNDTSSDSLLPINCSNELYSGEPGSSLLDSASADKVSDCRADSVVFHGAAEYASSTLLEETAAVDDSNNSSCNVSESGRPISRKSNKKRRKQLKLSKKAAAAAAAAAALSQLPLKANYATPAKSRKPKVPNMPSRNKKQVANVAVSCATEAIAFYKDSVLSRQKKIR